MIFTSAAVWLRNLGVQIYLNKGYEEDENKKALVDRIQQLPPRNAVSIQLFDNLRNRLLRHDLDKIDFDWPDGIRDEDSVANFRMYRRRTSIIVDPASPNIRQIASFLSSLETGTALGKVNVHGLGDDGRPNTKTYTLDKCLVAEIRFSEATYLLIYGRWYHVSESYIERMKASIRSLPDVTQTLQLPPISGDEGPYIASLAAARGWCVSDQRFWYASYDKFEHSDVIDIDNRQYICIKKGSSSQEILHLFHQIDNSARLIRLEPAFKQHVLSLMRETRPNIQDDWPELGTYVFAIASNRGSSFIDSLFLPSLIAMNDHVEAIRSRNFKVSVCRIQRI